MTQDKIFTVEYSRFSGVHPFHINFEMDHDRASNIHGQFLLNSNALQVTVSPSPAITYTSIGGIIDLYIFTGPTYDQVIQQYWDIIGVKETFSFFHTSRKFFAFSETEYATLLGIGFSSLPLWLRQYRDSESNDSSKTIAKRK